MAARLTYSEYLTTPQNFISVVARLKDGVTLAQANAELAAIGSRFIAQRIGAGHGLGRDGVPLRDARVEPTERQSALLLLAAAACVLAYRLRQRGQPAARARARAASRDRGPAGHRFGPAPSGAAAARRGAW